MNRLELKYKGLQFYDQLLRRGQGILFRRENDRTFHTSKLYVPKLQLDYNALGFYCNRELNIVRKNQDILFTHNPSKCAFHLIFAPMLPLPPEVNTVHEFS